MYEQLIEILPDEVKFSQLLTLILPILIHQKNINFVDMLSLLKLFFEGETP